MLLETWVMMHLLAALVNQQYFRRFAVDTSHLPQKYLTQYSRQARSSRPTSKTSPLNHDWGKLNELDTDLAPVTNHAPTSYVQWYSPQSNYALTLTQLEMCTYLC